MIKFGHVGITVKDVQRSYRFYTQVVGMKAWDQNKELGTTPNSGSEKQADSEFITTRSNAFDQLTNAHGTKIKYVNMRSADGDLMLQIVEYIVGGDGEIGLSHARAGSVHMNFFVDDVESKFDELNRRDDATVTSPIVQITPSMRSFYVSDPDGVPIEFLQVTGYATRA
jgi:catechol 2,3-dioxygenase-like lactoylglutathione lyase family enzyme